MFIVYFLLVYTDQYNDAWDVVNSAENLFLECSDLVEKLNTLTAPLLDIVTKQVTLQYTHSVLYMWYTNLKVVIFSVCVVCRHHLRWKLKENTTN